MSASKYLSCKEMCLIFPSIAELVFQSGTWDRKKYGLMQKCDGTTYFGGKTGEGKLQVTLQSILDMAEDILGKKYDPRTAIVFWTVDVENGDIFLTIYRVKDSRSEEKAAETFFVFRGIEDRAIPTLH